MTWVKRKSQTQAYVLAGESSLKRLNISQWWIFRFISYKNNTGIIIYIWLIHRKKYIWICIKITHFNSVTIHSQVRHKHSFITSCSLTRYHRWISYRTRATQNRTHVSYRTEHVIQKHASYWTESVLQRTERTCHIEHTWSTVDFGCYYFVLTI